MLKEQPVFCGLDTSLPAAGEMMRRNGCGFLPVVGEGGNVVGVITDRDIWIELGARDEKPADVLVRDVHDASDTGHCLFA
jgi:CBS domain-containing protein